MPTPSEGGNYYIRRHLPHIGPVRRTLGTKSKEGQRLPQLFRGSGFRFRSCQARESTGQFGHQI